VLRWNGDADGAVEVAGGGAKLRLPRLPELKPPPMRASAGAATTTSVDATASIAINARKPNRNMELSQPSRNGDRQPSAPRPTLYWDGAEL
jgi:hypothetical protein